MASEEVLATDEEDGERFVVKNFALTYDQAEWLRERAYKERRPQADIVREAIDKQRERTTRAEAKASG